MKELQTVIDDPYIHADKNTVTKRVRGFINPKKLHGIVGNQNEQRMFTKSEFGRKNKSEWCDLKRSLLMGWNKDQPILVWVEKNGSVSVGEGNHRLRAAIELGIDIYIEISWFGNSQTINHFPIR